MPFDELNDDHNLSIIDFSKSAIKSSTPYPKRRIPLRSKQKSLAKINENQETLNEEEEDDTFWVQIPKTKAKEQQTSNESTSTRPKRSTRKANK